ncbi:MAG TPA: putative hydroxymethylpyrimidine transporter CytX [Anaerolineae bacterium]
MNGVGSFFEGLRVKAPPSWGTEPVPRDKRILRGSDMFVFWSSLGVGLLVLQAGTLLVPGLSLRGAAGAIVVGTLVGSLLLALTGVIGSDTGAPTMVLLRPILGWRGSFLPTVFNVIQLIGWTAFEFWVIAVTASRVSQSVFGAPHYTLWLVVGVLFCLLLALGGPLVMVRDWLEKFGVWAMFIALIWISARLIASGQLPALWSQPGNGQMPFWLAVDLVVAMPISWIPLVADYNRFAASRSGSFWGTIIGYIVTNIWLYGLGALFVLMLNLHEADPGALAAGVMGLTGGLVSLVIILVDETDNVFASIYSSAISIQNSFPRLNQRWLIIAVTAVSAGLAAILTMAEYQEFLLLIGSVFVPLFGVLAADYFLVRRRPYDEPDLYGVELGGARDAGTTKSDFNLVGLACWIVGIVVYHLISRTLPSLGASIPSFVITFVGYTAAFYGANALRRRPAEGS